MEPRPRGRGNSLSPRLAHAPQLHFNGAPTSRSGKPPSRTSGKSTSIRPFTGAPTSRSGKLRSFSSGDSSTMRASMEPRPRGRGNQQQQLCRCGRRQCFNGAPTSRSGKQRPRIFVRTGAFLLQWSPDLAVGETVVPGVLLMRPILASMEPRPRGRGNVEPARLRDVKEHRFNGAPTSRSGKRAGAGAGAGERRVASMEPRPRGRGNTAANATWAPSAGGLQWSPDLAVGETALWLRGATLLRRLQWSPDLAVGETSASAAQAAGVRDASMEPRPRGRGNCQTSRTLS